MSAVFARQLARFGARLAAAREAEAAREIAAAGAPAGARAEAVEGGVALRGRGLARRWRRGDLAITAWIEGARARIGGRA